MTEGEWLHSANPAAMISHVRGMAARRKVRLFACALARLNWRLLYHRGSQYAVEVAERFVDGQATHAELANAHEQARRPTTEYDFLPALWECGTAWAAVPEQVEKLLLLEVFSQADLKRTYSEHERIGDPVKRESVLAAADLAYCAANNLALYAPALLRAITILQAPAPALVRDIFGNPFRPVTLDPAWRTATVVALAETIYTDRAFDRLPILADALEEAGCTSADLLNHCRQPGEHVRGCWALDLLLQKH